MCQAKRQQFVVDMVPIPDERGPSLRQPLPHHPEVLVQLPIFNEAAVVGRLVAAAAALDWMQAVNPNHGGLWIAGYSFGAFIGGVWLTYGGPRLSWRARGGSRP